MARAKTVRQKGTIIKTGDIGLDDLPNKNEIGRFINGGEFRELWAVWFAKFPGYIVHGGRQIPTDPLLAFEAKLREFYSLNRPSGKKDEKGKAIQEMIPVSESMRKFLSGSPFQVAQAKTEPKAKPKAEPKADKSGDDLPI